MRFVVLVTLLFGPTVTPWSKDSPEYWVVAASAVADVYGATHGTFAEMTLAKLKTIDPSLRHARVVRATRLGYCIEARLNGLTAFRNGPRARVLRGRCARPRDGRPIVVPVDRSPAYVRAAIPAIEAYYLDHGGSYAGMTIGALRAYDRGIRNIRIVRATRTTYCIESVTRQGSSFADGPGAPVARGTCPR